jgi:hypothetical protein
MFIPSLKEICRWIQKMQESATPTILHFIVQKEKKKKNKRLHGLKLKSTFVFSSKFLARQTFAISELTRRKCGS